MEGDWSSREGRLPRLDREGRTLSDSDYCLPSPPERDLSTIHLSQVSLDGGYGGDVSSETGSSEVFHHCQQPSYAHSEGYYSYVSSTDSITPFIDRLKRELEFTEVQENSSSASSHGGTSVKWEESDTDTFVAPRERSTNKIDSDSVWHFRGSSGDLVNTSSRTGLTNSSSRLASPPLSSDSSRLNYLSRVPLFHNASYESVNIDHATRLSSQSHVAPTGVTHTTRSQTGHGCTTTNSKATRMQANHCRSCDVAYTGRLQPSLGLEPGEIPYPVRLHSNGSACDNSGSERVQQSNNVIREHSSPRANKAQPQLSHSSRIQTTHSSNNESNNTSSNRMHSSDSTNHSSRINSNQNQSPHHASRIATSLSDTASHPSRHHSNHSDTSSLSSGVHTSHIESSSHTTRAHSVQSQSSTHTSVVHSNHGDPPNISNRLHSIHNESSSHCHSNKMFTIGEPPNITHSTRMHPTHCDSSSNHTSRIHSNHNEASVLNNSSRGYSSRGSSADFIGLSHSTRSHSSRSSSCEEVNQDHLSRHSAKSSSTESSSVSHPSRMHTHTSHSVSSESSTTTHPTRVHSHSSISSESSNGTHPSRIHSHSSLNSESSNTTHPSRVHSHSSLGVSESSNTSHPSRIHSHTSHTANSDSTTTNSHSSRMNSHSSHGTNSESVNSNHPTRIHSHSSLGVSEPSNTSHPSRKHSNSSHSISGESTNSNHPSRIHSHSSLGNESVSTTHSSRIHSHSSASSEPINTSLPSRIYTHSSHSVSNESANIARSSRVPPPQRHLSQSVLYLSADHRKLFPISTYQPEPPRVVGAVSVSERVVELENRLGGLKALQKKALLSFYQRHQASAPAPPPPPRRASSASDYLQLKGCIESSSTSSGSSQGSNGHKESTTASNSNTSSTSSNSLLKEARQLHSRSCGSLSGLSGPVIVGRSISVDDWVPARPPKGAHLRQAAPKQPSPEPPPAHTPRPAPTNTHQSSSQPCVATPLSQSPEKLSGSHRLNNPSESVRSGSQRNPPRAPSPEPPPPPPSPPQQYSDEPLPPPPGPDELPAPPLSLLTRHPSPGPQVPTHQSDSYQRSLPSELKTPTEAPVPTTRSITNIETKSYKPEDIGSSNSSLDVKPQKLSETSTLSNNSSASDLQLQYNLASSTSDKLCRDLLESLSSSTYDNRNKHTTSHLVFSSDLNCKTDRSNNSDIDKKEQIQRNSPLNHRKSVSNNDAQSQFNASCADLIDLETTIKSHSAVQPVPSNPACDPLPESKMSPLSSSPVATPPQNHLPTEVKCATESQPTLPRKVTPDIEGVTDKQQFNHCAIDLIQDIPVQQSPPKILSRNISRDNLCQPKPTERVHKNEDAQEESQTQEVKKLLRKTSFRCSERIQQSITTLQNSIRSSSPQKFQESQKELLYKDLLAKDILPKDLLKDILSKDPLAKEIFSNEINKDILSQDSSKQSLSKDFLTLDIMSKDSLNKEVSSKDPLSKGVITDKYSKDLVTKDIITKEIVTKELSENGISEDRWTSTIISTEASPSKLSLSLTRLDHIDITEKLISSFTSQKCGGADEKEDAKLDNLSDCDLEKSCSMSPSQLDPSISVGSLQQKKEELVTRLSRKLSVLRSEAAAVAEETSANEELGEAVVERVSSAWGVREASRLRSHVADLGRLTALLLTLTTRLARADNALLALSSCHPDKGALETKRDRLAGQLEEARRLKEKVDRRNEAVTSKLRERLTSDEFSDFMHFVSLKSKLLLDSREIADKIKLGEEQLQALQMTLSAVT